MRLGIRKNNSKDFQATVQNGFRYSFTGYKQIKRIIHEKYELRRIQSSKIQCFGITDFCEKEVIPMDLEIEQ